MSAPASRSASPPRSAPVQKRQRKPRPPPAHPPYVEMVRSAISTLKERGGSSRQKILQYILANFDVGNNPSQVNSRVRITLRSGVEKGILLRSANAKGANGSFRVGKVPAKKRVAKRKGKSPRKSPKKKARKVKRSAKKPKRSPKKKKAAKKAKRPAKARKPKRKSPKKKAAKPARRPKAKAKAKSRGRKR